MNLYLYYYRDSSRRLFFYKFNLGHGWDARDTLNINIFIFQNYYYIIYSIFISPCPKQQRVSDKKYYSA